LTGLESPFFISQNFLNKMAKFILGKKLGMTTIYDESKALNVTMVRCGAKVSLLKNQDKEGYEAIQLETEKTSKKVLKREFRVEDANLKEGDMLDVSIFEIGDVVKVSGISKAKGFQGGVKRHGFKGAPKTHGHKHDLRAPGSIGSGFPEHVLKGKRMAGRMGGDRITTSGARIVHIDKENNIIGIRGAVPGIPGGVVEIFVR
jgi:large subunit ribosomal protein L3